LIVQTKQSGHEVVPTGGTRTVEACSRRKLGERIKSARGQVGLSQAELAKKLGVSAGAVGQWEIGRGVPATERLATLADLLSISLDALLGKPQPTGTAGASDAATTDDLHLLAEARRLGVDLRQVVAEARQQRWREENREALADANAFLARNGLWSDGKRQF
jgi:transcriptional regulator with XRE-family HTH domain